MEYHGTQEDPCCCHGAIQGNSCCYASQQGRYEEFSMEQFTLHTHPTLYNQCLSDTSALGYNQVPTISLPGVSNNTDPNSQVSVPFPLMWNHSFTPNDFPKNGKHSPKPPLFLNQLANPSPSLETIDFSPVMLGSNNLSLDFSRLKPGTNGSDQLESLSNAELSAATSADLAGFSNLNEEYWKSNNDTWPLINQMSSNETSERNSDDAVLIGNMLEITEYEQQIPETNVLSVTTAFPQEQSKMLPVSGAASCATRSGHVSGDMSTRSPAIMQPTLLPINIQSTDMMSPLHILASMEKRFVVQDDIQSGSIRPTRTRDDTFQHRSFINMGNNNFVGKKLQTTIKKGSWSAERKISAAKMRKFRACTYCYTNKVKCSKDDICSNCQRLTSTPTPYQGPICHRAHLQDYLDLLLPDFLVKHLQQDNIQEYTSSLQYTEEEDTIQISTGHNHPVINLSVSRIIAPNKEFLSVPALVFAPKDHTQVLTTVETLEYALRDFNFAHIKQKWRDHIESISKAKNIIGDRGTLRYKLLLIICRFIEAVPVSKENDILRKSIMMSRILYTMDRLIVIKDGPGLKGTPNISCRSARALNRQMKGPLNDLRKEVTRDVLEGLGKQLRKNTTGASDIHLCTFLVLSMCIEDIQIAIDLKVLSEVSSESRHRSPIEQDGYEICTKLEKETLENIWILFNSILKKTLNNHPFRHGGKLDGRPGRHEAHFKFREELFQLILDYDTEISMRSCDRYQGGSSRTLEDHLMFRRRNEGRVSQYYFINKMGKLSHDRSISYRNKSHTRKLIYLPKFSGMRAVYYFLDRSKTSKPIQ